jgi:hypothetical protein
MTAALQGPASPRLSINDQIEFGSLNNRQIHWLVDLEDASGIDAQNPTKVSLQASLL